MLARFPTIWDGHLGTVKASKNIIEVSPADMRPIHSVPYRSGPPARMFERTEIYRLLRMYVMEPAYA